MREGAKNEGKNWGYKHVGEEAPRDPGVGAHDNLTGLLGLKIVQHRNRLATPLC